MNESTAVNMLWCNRCQDYRDFGFTPYCPVCGRQFEATIIKDSRIKGKSIYEAQEITGMIKEV